MTLTEFLLARIAEDEADVGHIDGVTAARVLAECEAKRRIVQKFTWDDLSHEPTTDPHGVLAVLARVYADHPDYDESWRP